MDNQLDGLVDEHKDELLNELDGLKHKQKNGMVSRITAPKVSMS